MRVVSLGVAGLVLVAVSGCGASAPRDRPSTGVPVDRSSATAVTATWDTGPNPAASLVTHGAAALATRLLHDIDAAPTSPFDTGQWSCPADLGSQVTLAFRSPGVGPVRIDFTGCAVVHQGDHLGRTVTTAIDRDLRPIAPPAFVHYLTQ